MRNNHQECVTIKRTTHSRDLRCLYYTCMGCNVETRAETHHMKIRAVGAADNSPAIYRRVPRKERARPVGTLETTARHPADTFRRKRNAEKHATKTHTCSRPPANTFATCFTLNITRFASSNPLQPRANPTAWMALTRNSRSPSPTPCLRKRW